MVETTVQGDTQPIQPPITEPASREGTPDPEGVIGQSTLQDAGDEVDEFDFALPNDDVAADLDDPRLTADNNLPAEPLIPDPNAAASAEAGQPEAPAAQSEASESGAPAPAAPAEGQPPQQPEAPAQPAGQQEQPQAQAQPEAPAPQPQAEQPDTLEVLRNNRDQFIAALSNEFRPSAEDLEELETNPGAAMSKMAAKVYYAAHLSMMQQLRDFASQQVPGIVQQSLATSQAGAEAEREFYDKWPGLKAADANRVRNIAMTYRQANPQATREQTFQDVGIMAHTILGIPLPQPQPPAPTNGRAPSGQPVQVTRQPASPGFVPAPTGVPLTKQPPSEEDPWAGMGGDYG